MQSERTIPIVPLALGLGGLVPFVGLALLVVTGWAARIGMSGDLVRAALLAYGAIIASFLGGIRWGLALRESGRAAALDLVLSVDQDLPRRGLAPAWFGRLRVILSGVAGLTMLAAASG